MTPAAGVTSQLQVLPQSVQFDDVSTEQQLHTTVTIKVQVNACPGACYILAAYNSPAKLMNFTTCGYRVPQNLDSRQHLLRWKPPKSKLFQVQGLATISKLAPGLQLSFKVSVQSEFPRHMLVASGLLSVHQFRPLTIQVNGMICRWCTKGHLARTCMMLLS